LLLVSAVVVFLLMESMSPAELILMCMYLLVC
jgi:hypothetical protein